MFKGLWIHSLNHAFRFQNVCKPWEYRALQKQACNPSRPFAQPPCLCFLSPSLWDILMKGTGSFTFSFSELSVLPEQVLSLFPLRLILFF